MCPHWILISTNFSRVGKETHLFSAIKIHQAEIWLSSRSVYSQTGNAMDAAEYVGREAERRACRAVVLSMDDYNASFLPHEGTVIFIVSTTGQGDTPDSMKVFWRFLLQRNLNC